MAAVQQAPAIKTPGSIWAKLIEQNSAQAKKPEGRGDSFVYFVGGRGTGKSTLLNRFLYPTRVEAPKPSEGLEYTFARKVSSYDHNKKDLAHIWEVGGGRELSEEAGRSDQLFLTVKQVTTAVVVITVDLSDPAAALPALLQWLDLVRRKLAATYEKFEKKGLQLPEQLRTRAKSKLYGSNEDKDVVAHTGIAIIIAATKYDTLHNQDPEVKKVISRTLRFIAHSHGASLMYLSGLHGMGVSSSASTGVDNSTKSQAADKALLDSFTRLLNHMVFTGLEKKPSFKLAAQLDHSGPIVAPAGSDRLRDIGRPKGHTEGSLEAGLQEWREVWERLFPPKASTASSGAPRFIIDDKYRDEEIDVLAARKVQEADALRKEADQAKETAKKKLTTASGATGALPVKKKAAPGTSNSKVAAPAAGVSSSASVKTRPAG